MKKTSRIISLCLAVMFIVSCIALPASAVGGCNSDEYLPLTQSELNQIEIVNRSTDSYINGIRPSSVRLGGARRLNVPCYQQINNHYCGVASTQMIVDYKDRYYSQQTIAGVMGDVSGGSSSAQIVSALNHYIGSGTYAYTTTSASTLSNDMVRSIDNDYPMVCSVKEMPDYKSTAGHFIVLTGYDFGAQGSIIHEKCYYNDPHWDSRYYGPNDCTYSQLLTAINSNAGKYIRYAK